MKIAITATGNSLDSMIDERFGRCAWFIIVETDDLSFEAIRNENIDLPNGAGIKAAGFIASKGVRAVLTGRCGPNATQVFAETGIAIVPDCTGTVRQAIESFKSSAAGQRLSESKSDRKTNLTPEAPTPPQNSGMGGGMGRGMGMGGGMGRGMGLGGGMGRGMGGRCMGGPGRGLGRGPAMIPDPDKNNNDRR